MSENNQRIEEEEVRTVLEQMVQRVIEFCESDGKLSAPEKRIIKAMVVFFVQLVGTKGKENEQQKNVGFI